MLDAQQLKRLSTSKRPTTVLTIHPAGAKGASGKGTKTTAYLDKGICKALCLHGPQTVFFLSPCVASDSSATMGRRARSEINKASGSTSSSDTEDERGVPMQCTENCHWKCSECGVQRTGSHNWKKIEGEWFCENCWLVKSMKDWDPWMKMVPETPTTSSTAQASTWVAPIPTTQSMQPNTDSPVPNDTINAAEIPVPNDEDTMDAEIPVDDQGDDQGDEQPPRNTSR